MAFVDTLLLAPSGYSYVHCGQIYNTLATLMTGHSNWTYVEYIDTTNGANTYRRHVWRCKSTGSGLPSDFYVVFETVFNTSTSLYDTATPVKVWLGETYASGVLGKFASTYASITPTSDLTNPATFTLSTYTIPATLFNPIYVNHFGTTSSVTSMRIFFVVATDCLIITRTGGSNGTLPSTQYLLYVGAYESIMSVADDPMPLVLMGNATSTTSSYIGGAFTRAPQMTPGVAITEVYAAATYDRGEALPNACYPGRSALGFPLGVAGNPSSTNYWKNTGATASRCPVNTWLSSSANASTKGLFRGYLKNVVCAIPASHSYGDQFKVEGKNYVGLGIGGGTTQGPLINTEAV